MKLSNLSVIFIVIMLPLAVILSTYMQLQSDVLLKKVDYSSKLLDSAYDAIVSFELNSLSIDNSTEASVKDYVADAVNTFFNTMSINMGASNQSNLNIQTYVPAMLFTTYDGYYIYSPVKTSTVDIDYLGKGIAKTGADEEVLFKTASSGSSSALYGDTNPVTYDDSSFSLSYNYMVKPFIYYSANYIGTNYDVVINYSLDNHIALYGKYTRSDGKSNAVVTKSGYLINTDNINIGGSFYVEGKAVAQQSGAALDSTSEINAEVEIPSSLTNIEDLIECPEANYTNGSVTINDPSSDVEDWEYGNGAGYFIKDGLIYAIRGNFEEITGRSDFDEIDLYSRMTIPENTDEYTYFSRDYDYGGEYIIDYTLLYHPNDITVTVHGITIDDLDAKAYYLKAYYFTKWVKQEFGRGSRAEIKCSDVDTSYYENYGDNYEENKVLAMYSDQGIDVNFSDDILFDGLDGHNDPEDEASIFVQHKHQVIQNSIQYNLNSAISTYSELYSGSTSFTMPVLSDTDWENILNKITFVVFMQGVPCGTTTWGDYAVATSTNNKIYVNKSNLLFLDKSGLNNGATANPPTYYHRVDCGELKDIADTASEIYAAMSYEFDYDAEEQEATIYALESGGNYVKYFYYNGNWYNYKGVQVSNDDTLQNNAILLSSAYVKFSASGAKQKCLFIDDGTDNWQGYRYFKYTGTESGILSSLGTPYNDDNNNPKKLDTDGIHYTNSYQQAATDSLYLYDHVNLPCYWCMMGSSYEVTEFETWKTQDATALDEGAKKIMKAWYTYIAKYRNNQYKTTNMIQR